MKFVVEVNLGNSAFENPIELNKVVNRAVLAANQGIWCGDDKQGMCIDSNGNIVGSWRLEPDY